MNEKSHVALAQSVCPVCAKVFENGELLLDTRLRATLNRHEVTGFRMCAEHKRMKDDGYTALVGIDEAKSDKPLTPASVWRTGEVAHIRNEVWPSVFNVPLPSQGMCFVDADVLTKLREASQ